jgi:hypothetical protein
MTKPIYRHVALFRGPARIVVRVSADSSFEAAEALSMFLREDVNVGSAAMIDRDHEISMMDEVAVLQARANQASDRLETFRAMMREAEE